MRERCMGKGAALGKEAGLAATGRAGEKSDFFCILLVPHPSSELRKQLPREVAGIGWVDDILAAEIVVEDPVVGGFVDVGQAEIHVVAFDGACHATDEDYGAIRLLPLDDSDVRQWVIHLAIPVVVPCIIEEDEIAGVDNRSLVERALLPYVGMDDPDAVDVRVARFTAIEVDSVFEKNRPGHPGAVIGDASAVALNRFGANEFGRCPHDRAPARPLLDGSTTGARFRCRSARVFRRRRGTAHERHDCDSGHDEEESHRPHRTLTNRPWAVSRS